MFQPMTLRRKTLVPKQGTCTPMNKTCHRCHHDHCCAYAAESVYATLIQLRLCAIKLHHRIIAARVRF